MTQTIIDPERVRNLLRKRGVDSLSRASIRDIVRIVNILEKESGQHFIRMEMGVPGLPAPAVGIEAEIDALRRGVASRYPMIEGLDDLKSAISRFTKLFLDIDVDPQGCIPTVGSMMGAFVCFLTANRNDRTKEGTLFLDPGFPVQKQQCRVLGQDFESIDVYDHRGPKLEAALENILGRGKTSTILYSNPNNPSWICFTEDELKTIARAADRHDVIVIEDLAYLCMDFRRNTGKPGHPPYQPTVARYTDQYILLISSSKAFSYAGQRIGMMVVSDALFKRRYPDLLRYYASDVFGQALIYGAIYAISSGTSHSAQYGLKAMLEAACDGRFDFVAEVKEYGRRAHIMKDLFTRFGFRIVYDRDLDHPLADGFYFTLSYPGLDSGRLLEDLLCYGISAISLAITGSVRTEGIRACVSQIGEEKFPVLEDRLRRFHEEHPLNP
jgi:aspartate/methionine/tyrosine aminotransferase